MKETKNCFILLEKLNYQLLWILLFFGTCIYIFLFNILCNNDLLITINSILIQELFNMVYTSYFIQ